ncbi:MAG TPA: VWA domain-containing protein [Polyangiaceae bacterium]|nr:VWA domain-containing protein [Polyangiaceae bacterium]
MSLRSIPRRPVLLAFAALSLAPALYTGLVWAGVVRDHLLRFERPLWSVPCALVLLFIALCLTELSPRQGAFRRTLVEGAVAVSALCLMLAVLGCEIGKPLDRLAVIVALDRSRSIDLVPGAEARIASELRVAELGMRDDDRIASVAFAADAVIEDALRPKSRLPSAQVADVGRDGTDLAAGMRRALSEVPADFAARVVLVSDGVSTRGDPMDAASAAALAGVPVDVVPLDQSQLPDVRVVSVRTTPRANVGETLDIRVATASSSEADVEIRLYRDGELVQKGVTRVAQGEDVLRLREVAPDAGLHRYEVQLSALDAKHDQAPEDNSGSTFLRVRGEAIALVLEQDPALAEPLALALESAAFKVQRAGPAGMPADLAGFAAYDLIVLSDIAAAEIAPSQLDALASYVRDMGGGLLLMGGDRAFGPGGYGKTPIEEVSPVSFDLKQERRRASLAEIIAIDYSGSMAARVGSKTKLDLANEAAARSAELLGAGDRLGVMHVDTAVRWTLPLGPVSDTAAIAKAIRSVSVGGGGIYIDLTLKNAYEALGREKVNLKHLLLFSDGSDAEERQNAPALVSAAKARGITTSVIALGRGGDVAALEHMSKLGDGRFYLIEDASRLPSVFAQETILAARSAINEVEFRALPAAPGAAIRGIDLRAAPSLTGYVVTIGKSRAQVHLRAAEGDPLLATWSIGVGRSAVFTSDYKDRWGRSWTGWNGATQLFGQLARDIARRADDARVRVEADAAGGELHVRANVVDDDGRAESFRRLKVRIGGPDGFSRDVTLEAVGAGAYASRTPLSRPGAYIVTAVDELTNEPLATTGAVLTAGEELRPTGSDRRLLGQIASLTGGKLRDTLAGIFHDREAKRFAYRSIDAWLTALAAFALLGSVAARRLALPEALLRLPERLSRRRAERRARREHTDPAEAAGAEQTERALSALIASKKRAAAPRRDETQRRAPASTGDAGPSSVPHMAAPSPPSTRPPAAGTLPSASDPAPAHQKLSAAEILLARRRGRKQ